MEGLLNLTNSELDVLSEILRGMLERVDANMERIYVIERNMRIFDRNYAIMFPTEHMRIWGRMERHKEHMRAYGAPYKEFCASH